MKEEFAKNSNIVVRPIGTQDWQAYRDYYKGLSNPIVYTGFTKGADLDDPDTYSKIFDDMAVNSGDTQMLGLWQDDRIIGQFLYFIEHDDQGKPTAIVQGLEIADGYKGRGLFKKLTDSVADHLRSELGRDARVYTTIRQDNATSLKIAKFYGMKIVEDGEYAQSYQEDGYYLLEYTANE